MNWVYPKIDKDYFNDLLNRTSNEAYGFIYILEGQSNGTVYIGATDDLQERFTAHRTSGLGQATCLSDIIVVSKKARFRIENLMIKRAKAMGWSVMNGAKGKPKRGFPRRRFDEEDQKVLMDKAVQSWLSSLGTNRTRKSYMLELVHFFRWMRSERNVKVIPTDLLDHHRKCLGSEGSGIRAMWSEYVRDFLNFTTARRFVATSDNDLQNMDDAMRARGALSNFFNFHCLPLTELPRRAWGRRSRSSERHVVPILTRKSIHLVLPRAILSKA